MNYYYYHYYYYFIFCERVEAPRQFSGKPIAANESSDKSSFLLLSVMTGKMAFSLAFSESYHSLWRPNTNVTLRDGITGQLGFTVTIKKSSLYNLYTFS